MSRGETEQRTSIAAPPELVYATFTDYESYPKFFTEFDRVRILEVNGPIRQVEFVAKIGMELNYTLEVTHYDDELRTSWTYVSGSLEDATGSWQVLDDGQGGSTVIYRLSAAVRFFVPTRLSNWLIEKTMPRTFAALKVEVNRRLSLKKSEGEL